MFDSSNPDVPTVSRVMRITPGLDEKPAKGFSWADYEDVDVEGLNLGLGESSGGGSLEGDEGVRGGEDADGEDDEEGGWVVKNTKKARTCFPLLLNSTTYVYSLVPF